MRGPFHRASIGVSNNERLPDGGASRCSFVRFAPGYLPVFMNWTQSPWFLKDEPSVRSRFIQPPFLQSFLLFVFAAFSPRWTSLTVQRPASSAMTNGVAPTCHVGCAATNAAQFGSPLTGP